MITPYYHGTKVKFEIGDKISPGFPSNYGKRKMANYVYFTGTLDAAIWGAELAKGEGKGFIYIVEPTGDFEDDPNLTNKKFPGNPTLSYRTDQALIVVSEMKDWEGHSQDVINKMLDNLKKLSDAGIEAINE